MAEPRRDHRWEIMKRSIYVLIFEKERCFFVGKTSMERLWHVYDYHFRERQVVTRDLFRKYKESGQLPEMYLLEEIVGTNSDAFQRCILWTRYFWFEHDYEPMVGYTMEDYVNDLNEEMIAEYQKIKETPIDSICNKEKNLFPEFKNSRKQITETPESPKNRRVELRLRSEEYQRLKAGAEKHNVSLSEYILNRVRNAGSGSFNVDTSFLEEHTRTVNDCHNLLAGILVTYLQTGKLYPADIAKMEEIANIVAESNAQAAAELNQLCQKLRDKQNSME